MDGDIEPDESGVRMGRAALVLATVLLGAAPIGTDASSTQRASGARPAAKPAAPAPKKAPPGRRGAAPPASPATLSQAKAAMSALMRDKTRRRFRHNWERGIAGLLGAARGKDAPEATFEAARARYALYRWSANEADRDEALRLAARAAKLGSREAPALAKAIRREAGDEGPRKPPARPPAGGPRLPEPVEDEPPLDPALEAAIAALTGTAPPRPPGSPGAEGPARVTEVRTWSSDHYTRVAIYLSHWAGWEKLELQAEPDRPRRFAIDLRPAVLQGAALQRSVPGGQVHRVRAAQNMPETVRVVLDLAGADAIEVHVLEDPPRLVLDVGTETAQGGALVAGAPAAGASAGGAAGDAPAAASGSPMSGADAAGDERRAQVRRVVVDAGHGGHDPGAIGPRRVREKDVTLAIAHRLARRLRAAGFEVVLTRRDDRYLALEERTAIANTARADLFVSIHANAHPRRERSGVETYFLNVADDRYTARLAARENGIDPDGQGDLLRILTDLDAKASAGASRRLASLVQHEITAGIRGNIGEVRDLGVKSALFYVLLGARMPAVLVEAGFISNRDEERRLASARYQEEVAAGVARGIAAFARAGDRVAAAPGP
jgi:N-acetylmuramoyl-L-alanine amidase